MPFNWQKAMQVTTMCLESSTSTTSQAADTRTSGWLKLGLIAAASALAGGLAAAWWYRNTLSKLNQAETSVSDPDCGTPGYDPSDES
jgi:hypothetical protein